MNDFLTPRNTNTCLPVKVQWSFLSNILQKVRISAWCRSATLALYSSRSSLLQVCGYASASGEDESASKLLVSMGCGGERSYIRTVLTSRLSRIRHFYVLLLQRNKPLDRREILRDRQIYDVTRPPRDRIEIELYGEHDVNQFALRVQMLMKI
ncbi:uncharacterized protein ZBAI_03017 [Zygosaccharomyces bailii ISA1307]|nr:uncharacterized protein ZBAI_03017 [Zygosaccharomyces bailii ISA1307]